MPNNNIFKYYPNAVIHKYKIESVEVFIYLVQPPPNQSVAMCLAITWRLKSPVRFAAAKAASTRVIF